jgi:hypothetical protein
MPWFRRRSTSTGAEIDAAILSELTAHGADLAVPREVTHYLLSDQRTGLEQIAREVRARGWSITVEQSDEYEATVLEAMQMKVVNADVAAVDRELFEALAKRLPDGR